MASLQAKIDAIKAAVSTTSSCTPTTVVSLKDLLLPESEQPAPRSKSTTRATKTPVGGKTKNSTVSKKASGDALDEALSARDRTALATNIINLTIKSLTEASKPPPPSTPVKQNDGPRQANGKRTLRRSLSAPLSPLPSRTLNRVATLPNGAAIPSKNGSQAQTQSTGCLATVECARVAFACLRSTRGPILPDQTDFQLENGMSALVGKLLGLNMHDQALKELRILKRRLNALTPSNPASNSKDAQENNVSGAADLLEFNGTLPKQSLSTVVAYQTQVLKLITATKKPAHIEAILPHLNESIASSPFNILSTLAKSGEKEAAKAARQLASLSQMLLSLAPSVSSQEDAVAMEPRLSPSPQVAFELQVLAFRTQLGWWRLAGHQGNIDNEILSPFARCVRAFVRRQKSDDPLVYQTISTAFDNLLQLVHSQKYGPETSPDSPLVLMYQLLGCAAQSARQYDEAYRWFYSLKKLLPSAHEPSVRSCSIAARLLASALKQSKMAPEVDQIVHEVIDGLDGSLSGTVAELNELLESLSLTRRSVVGVLMNVLGPNALQDRHPRALIDLLKTFVLRYPRFVRRWMGLPPGKDASPKQVLQFDQRRQLVMQSIGQVLDATLLVVKCDIQTGACEWQTVDDVLQHCVSLLEAVSDSVMSIAKTEQVGGYYVKISSLYFSMFSQLRKESSKARETNKQILQALNRSIDSVKDRSASERDKAQLLTKLELFADLCKGAGRNEDAVRTLRSICTTMAEDGVLSDVATALATQPPSLAWHMNEKASTMSRTLRSIAKLDRSWNDWTFFLPETERAAVLEHLMHIRSLGASSSSQPLRLRDPGLTALLRIYTSEKYPVRRLRVLLHLFYQNIGETEDADDIISHVDEALDQVQQKQMAEDAALVRYIPHLQTYHASISALVEADAPLFDSCIKDAISTWKSMVGACQNETDLHSKIDDPKKLLDHLLSLSQFAGMRGGSSLQLAILELSIALSKCFVQGSNSDGEHMIISQSHLVAQYVSIGLFPRALKTLEQTEELVNQYEGLSRRTLASFHLSQAEYHAGIGNTDAALACLSKASNICNDSYSSWAQNKSQATMMLSMTSLLQSTVALQTGDIQDALTSIKSAVRMLSHDWSKLEASLSSAGNRADLSIAESNNSQLELKTANGQVLGPRFWSLASPLLRCLLHISSVYAHIGMFQETVYYAESAWKIAENTQSPLYKAQVSSWIGSVYLKAGKLEKALTIFNDVESQMPRDICSSRVRFARQVGEFYWEMGENDKALKFLEVAEKTALLLSVNEEPADIPVEQHTEPTIKAKASTSSRATRATKTTRAKTPVASRGQSKAVSVKAKLSPPVTPLHIPTDVYQASLFAAIILSRTLGLINQKDWASALTTLEQVRDLPKLTGTLSQEQVMTAVSLIGHSMEQMISDPVFSVMQDSTISFPAIFGSTERCSPEKPSPCKSPRKGRGVAASRKLQKDHNVPVFTDALRQAQELLMNAHASALSSSDSSMVHRISALLQSTIIFLSATSATKSKSIPHSGLATVAVDMARNITWRREQETLDNIASKTNTTASSTNHSSSLGFTTDMTKFQKSYVDMVPKKWSVISISLSDNRHDLCITKFQAGNSPFILRLPLERANSRDADSEVFNFEHGREGLLNIIKLANETSHSARDFTAKGERGAWWAERDKLDNRLKDLLMTIETTWLGGFKGIFSQHRRQSDLLARFQKSFHQMLDRSLPSRSRVRGKKTAKAPSVTLDPRILDLFIGLGDPTDPDCDFDEALNDLLYFVVDILQFHGERNAYDEIDFDAMVIETYDALRGYYSAAKSESDREDGAHTVLVLDKALHAFPWESLPCMQEQAVSRVPSLACLRQLILEANFPSKTVSSTNDDSVDEPQGHYVSANAGTYILNPSSDLKNTQTFFQSSFSSLESWTGIVNEAPDETSFEKALSSSDLLVYFGHGSGAQYIRGKTIRRLEKCKPATFLMGCSSAALTEAGEFECYGPVWNYMMAGCPAVVGTLWDVTDRDIDRFAGRTFEEWGLFARGTFDDQSQKGRSKGKGPMRSSSDVSQMEDGVEDGGGKLSLAEALARARGACRFKYLNAAAVVLYGIPVYIK